MSSPPSAPPALQGAQEPRHLWRPPGAVSSAGAEAVELAAMAGLVLDPWEAFVLDVALGERADGRWSAFEVGLAVPRQNGKGAVLEARELAGLYLLGERLLQHSAHLFDTSLEAFRRLLALIEGRDELSRRVKRVSKSHGEEGIELIGGQRIRFRTRTRGGGRGFTGDLLVLDEAMDLPVSAHGALLPTLSARPNPQVWYTGSAVDRRVHDHGVVFAKVRQRGLAGGDAGLAYLEWSADADAPEAAAELGPEAWAQANPGLGIRISVEHVELEQRSMDARTFGVERLNVGDWPDVDPDEDGGVIDTDTWQALEDRGSSAEDPVCFALDVRPDRSAAAIGVAGRRHDDRRHVEVVEHKAGTGWLVEYLVRLQGDHKPPAILYDERSPAAAVVQRLEAAGVKLTPVSAREHAEACGALFDAAIEGTLRHLGHPELDAAVRGAAARPLGDAWAWSRKSSAVDISPLVAVTLALYGFEQHAAAVPHNAADYRIVQL